MDLRGFFYCSNVLHIAWSRTTKRKRKKGRKKERKEKKINTKQARPEADPVWIKDRTQEKRTLGVYTGCRAREGGC